MDRRVFLALALSAIVVVVFQFAFPTRRPVPRTAADSVATGLLHRDSLAARRAADSARARTAADTTRATATPAVGAVGAIPGDTTSAVPAVPAVRAETAVVRTPKVEYRISSLGAAPVGAALLEYSALAEDGSRTPERVQLVRPGDALVKYRVVSAGDTISLDQVPFALTRATDAAGRERLDYTAALPTGLRIAIGYTFAPDSYLVRVAGRVEGGSPNAFVMVELPRALGTAESDTVQDRQQFAVAYKPVNKDAVGLAYQRMDPEDGPTIVTGDIAWAVNKSKYFIVGLLTPANDMPFKAIQVAPASVASVRGFFGTSQQASTVRAAVVEQLAPGGTFAFELYAGPQEFRRLESLGREFETANPYGGFLQGIVQPFATIVMRILLWMKATLGVGYGWILVIFGILVRLLMWPLQQSSMRTSIKMQRIQPQMQAIQERHRNDPQRLQQEMMKIYKEHGVSPFSMFSGCLPILITMPVFFALFFVFQNTIEFRGVPFLWLKDISIYDPYYILPIVMGLSSFLTMWIGMRGAPPNPQQKMMAYIFPAMMVFFLWRFASGLNLYYTVQNIAALPQQWLLVREREKLAKK